MKKDNLTDFITVVDNRSLVEKVELKLIDLFATRNLKPGDSIPRETDLAEAMGVSRTVIRESLTRLRTMDIIDTKKHSGAIIKSPNFFYVLQKSMIPNILDNSTLRDIFELRLVVEIGMADLVFHRKTDADIKELEDIVRSEPERSDLILFDIRQEIRFHGKLYKMSGNESLSKFQSLLLPLFKYVYDSGLVNKPVRKTKYFSHKGLVAILKSGDSSRFRNAMREHLENHFQRILDRN